MLGWTFLNPLFLWGLGLGAVPILLHLLQRRRYHVRPWGAMAFLRVSTRNTARRLRIEQLLLLLVRIAILMLAALALSRPIVPPSSGGALSLLSRQSRVHATLLIDHSYSMGAGRPANWERAKARSLELIREGLRPGDSISVILAGSPPRALIRRPTFDLEEARRRIQTATVSDGGTDFARAARLCLETLGDAPHPNREVYLVTDNQAAGWSASAPRVWTELSRLARLHVVVVGDGGTSNVTVADAGAVEGLVSTRRPAGIEARIVNHDDGPHAGQLVTLVMDGRAAASTRVDLPARGEARARFTHLVTAPGVHAGSIRVTPDRLPRDDEAFFRIHARDHVRVLCLNGRPSVEPRRDAAFYLLHALSPGGDGSDTPGAFIRTTATTGALTAASLRGVDVVVLADVPALPALDARVLADYLGSGGGALVFLGDGTRGGVDRSTPGSAAGRTDGGTRSDLLSLFGFRASPPVSTTDSGPRGGVPPSAATPGLTLDASSFDHPILARFRSAGDVDLATATFAGRARLGIGESGGRSAADRQAQAMARFTDGSLAWVETRVGRGRAILAAHTAGVEGSTLPYKPAFVLLMHQAVAYLAQDADAARRLTVGDRLVKALEQPAAGEPRPTTTFTLTDPGGQRATLSASVLATERAPTVRYDRTERAGHYRLTRATAQSPPEEIFAVNLPRGEGDPRRIGREELARRIPEARFHWIDPNQPLSAALRQARLGLELWRPLVIAVLLLMFLESFMAQRFGRQATTSDQRPTTNDQQSGKDVGHSPFVVAQTGAEDASTTPVGGGTG